MRAPKRRFVDLQVDEVSLVDTPANEIPFLVTKNHTEDDDMTVKSAPATEEQTTKGAEAVPVTQTETAAPEAVQKALDAVNSIVAKVASLVEKAAPAAPAAAGDKPAEEKPTEKAAEKPAEAAPATAAAAVATVTKSAEELMVELSETIQKGARLTPARVEQIKQAIDTLKLVIEGVAQGTSPSTNTPQAANVPSGIQSQLGANEKPVIKAGDVDVAEGFAKLTKAIEGLTESLTKSVETQKALEQRVEQIEKAKPAPSGEGEQGTNTTTKKSTGMWTGIL